MKFAIDPSQREYYKKNGFLPLEGLLNREELASLNQGIDEVLSEKKNKEPIDPFLQGRDLFRKNEKVKKIVFSKRLIELTYELLQKKPIRLAFDQLLPEKKPRIKEETLSYADGESFQAHSAIAPLEAVLLLCIKSGQNESSDLPLSSVLQSGNGCFISPANSFPFTTVAPSPDHRFLLIGYTSQYSQYLYEPKDPLGYFLKSLGYVYGDKLNDNLHPILLR